MTSADLPRPHARVHLNVFQPFGPVYEWSRTPHPLDYYAFESYLELVRDAERGLFTALFLGESLRLREHLGRLNDIAITGRPDALVLFSYLAARTERIGLVATLNTTYTDPVDLARRIATVDVLSGGRAGWNIVTTDNAWTGENFRRGGHIANADRYRYAQEHVATVQQVWDDFAPDALATSPTAPSWSREGAISVVERDGEHIRARIVPRVPHSPQGQAVYFQAGDSDEGRDFAARWAEGVFTHHVELDDAIAFTADIRARARRIGRAGDDLAIFPGARIVLGATRAEAEERDRHLRDHALTDRRVRQAIEEVWQEDLSGLDLDGPLPEAAPAVERQSATHGIVHTGREPAVRVREWRRIAAEHGFTVRRLVHHLDRTSRFVGTPGEVADRLAHAVRADAFDGLNVVPDAFPDGLRDIVDLLVPELQERGVYPDSYAGTTLRRNLGLPDVPAHRLLGAGAGRSMG